MERYDPVSVGILIVSIATLALSIYAGHRKKTPNAAPEVVERILRSELRREIDVTPDSIRISQVIVNETVERVTKNQGVSQDG